MNEEQASVEKILTEPDYDYEGFVDYIYDGDTYKLWYGRIGSGSGPTTYQNKKTNQRIKNPQN